MTFDKGKDFIARKEWADSVSVCYPPLSGSEKQSAWAHILRADFISQLNNSDLPDKDKIVVEAKANDSAKFWIKIRHCGFKGMVDALFTAKKRADAAKKEDDAYYRKYLWAVKYTRGFPPLRGEDWQLQEATIQRAKFFERFDEYTGPDAGTLRKHFMRHRAAQFWIGMKDKPINVIVDEWKKNRAEERGRLRQMKCFGKADYVIASCGHKIRLRHFPGDPNFENWLKKDSLCLDCCAKAVKKWVRELKDSGSLPPLTGSPKQVAWAESIREGVRLAFESLKAREADDVPYFRIIPPRERIFGSQAFIDFAWGKLVANTEAEFWIGLRDMTLQEIWGVVIKNS